MLGFAGLEALSPSLLDQGCRAARSMRTGMAALPAHPVPGGIFTLGMPRMMILCRRATRLGFT